MTMGFNKAVPLISKIKSAQISPGALGASAAVRRYFSNVLTETNLSLRTAPTPPTAATIATPMPIAIKAYSMDVAPD